MEPRTHNREHTSCWHDFRFSPTLGNQAAGRTFPLTEGHLEIRSLPLGQLKGAQKKGRGTGGPGDRRVEEAWESVMSEDRTSEDSVLVGAGINTTAKAT